MAQAPRHDRLAVANPSAAGAGRAAARRFSAGLHITMTTLYFVRHAQSLPHPDCAEPDWPLSLVGIRQARGLIPILQALGLRRLYASPYRRCQATLAPFAEASGVELQLHAGLRERKISPVWQGDFREIWRRSWADYSFALDGGESSWTCRERIAATVAAIAARHPGETIGLGSHGNAIGLFLNYVDAAAGLAEASALRTPEIVKIVWANGRFTWERGFSAGPDFDALATEFRATPGVIA